jgi:hypothetical protein
MALTQVPNAMLGSDAQFMGFKNRIINGAMAIAQRATSASITTSWSYLTVDRFVCNQDTSAAGTMSQVSISDLQGFRYAAKIQRTASSGATGAFHFGQAIESNNSADLQGKQVTLSFYAKCGANFSASGSQISALIANGAVVDQPVTSIPNAVVSGSQTITTSWQRFYITGTVASNSTQLGWYLTFTPTGTAGADDSLYITGVQLEAGGAPTAFDFREYGAELRMCQRYYYRYSTAAQFNVYGVGYNYGTSTSSIFMTFPVPMRARPTGLEAASAGSYLLQSNGSNLATTALALGSATSTNGALVLVSATVTNGLAAGLIDSSGTSYLGFTGAEL